MSPWKRLYAMTWIVVLEFLLAMTPGAPALVGALHVALGLAILGLAVANFRSLRATAVPARVKRTARATVQLAAAATVLGALLVADVGTGWTLLFGVTVWGVLLLLHVFLALGILAQAAAVGIAYDMWEEKEFAQETPPGDVPAPERPAAPARSTRARSG